MNLLINAVLKQVCIRRQRNRPGRIQEGDGSDAIPKQTRGSAQGRQASGAKSQRIGGGSRSGGVLLWQGWSGKAGTWTICPISERFA